MALHVHVDALWTYAQHVGAVVPKGPDPVYTRMMPRLIDWAEQAGATLTLFIVGRDLDVPLHADLVRQWHAKGHEIASHSWSHPPQFLALDAREAEAEIRRAHRAIADTVGLPPVGYAAPGWYDDRRVWPVLAELGYRYDCSLFPSWLMMLQPPAVYWLSPAARDRISIWRRDWPRVMFGPSRRHASPGDSRLVASPMPVSSLRLPFWHSLAFSLSERSARRLIGQAMRRRPDDYYHVAHPLDVLDPAADFEGEAFSYLRSNVTLSEKTRVWNAVMDNFVGRRIVAMRNLVEEAV